MHQEALVAASCRGRVHHAHTVQDNPSHEEEVADSVDIHAHVAAEDEHSKAGILLVNMVAEAPSGDQLVMIHMIQAVAVEVLT